MKGYTIRFRAEKRGTTVENVPLLFDLRFHGKVTSNTGIRLLQINDFILDSQSFRRNSKVKYGGQIVSASLASTHLELIKEKVNKAYQTLLISGNAFTVKDIYNYAFKEGFLVGATSQSSRIKRKSKQASKEKPNETVKRIADSWLKEGVIGQISYYKYTQIARTIDRFNKITSHRFDFHTCTLDTILAFKDFLINEYQYFDEFPDLYKGERYVRKPRANNTAVTLIKRLNAIFSVLKLPNPLDETRRKGAILAERYGEVIALTKDELYQIVDADVPEDLQFVKDCFVVHCSLGARVADYHRLSQFQPIQHSAGFLYLVYAAAKTNAHSKTVETTQSPLLDFASEVVKRYGYMPFRDWLFGDITTTYNEQIRQLLKYIGIDRPVSIRTNEGIKQVPLWQEASSKLARKTFVSISDNAPVGAYLAGLHKEGSDAVKHYISKSVEDRYNFLKFAFGR